MSEFPKSRPNPEERAQRRLSEAEGYVELGLYAEADKRIAEAEAAGLLPLECALLRGEALRRQDRFAEALPHFHAALALEPGHLVATIGAGWCLKRLDRVADAARVYHEALKHRDDEALLHYNLACYLSLLGRADDALLALDAALKLEPHMRELAKDESDFDPLRELPAFQARLKDDPAADAE